VALNVERLGRYDRTLHLQPGLNFVNPHFDLSIRCEDLREQWSRSDRNRDYRNTLVVEIDPVL